MRTDSTTLSDFVYQVGAFLEKEGKKDIVSIKGPQVLRAGLSGLTLLVNMFAEGPGFFSLGDIFWMVLETG